MLRRRGPGLAKAGCMQSRHGVRLFAPPREARQGWCRSEGAPRSERATRGHDRGHERICAVVCCDASAAISSWICAGAVTPLSSMTLTSLSKSSPISSALSGCAPSATTRKRISGSRIFVAPSCARSEEILTVSRARQVPPCAIASADRDRRDFEGAVISARSQRCFGPELSVRRRPKLLDGKDAAVGMRPFVPRHSAPAMEYRTGILLVRCPKGVDGKMVSAMMSASFMTTTD